MKRPFSLFFVCMSLLIVCFPYYAQATTTEISGWIPYWKVVEGTKDARANLDILTELNPFTLSVTTNGDIKDLSNMKKSPWTKLFKEARKKGLAIIPTVMWSDTYNIHRILSDKDLRKNHIDKIVKFIKKNKFDGVDIDYENKKLATKHHFSDLLTELKTELGDKKLACTIEARTPSSTYEYMNDLDVIGKVCDQVRIMTYDQQRADAKLNNDRSGTPYIPVGDIDWVEKVAKLVVKSVPKEKVMLGVATYGREWEVSVTRNSFNRYSSLWTVTHDYSVDFADQMDITPIRNAAGELSLTYFATSSPYGKMLKQYKAPKNTPDAYKASAQALAYANATGNTAFFNIIWWSDAEAIASKLKLAKSLGLRGISIFKIDGSEDDKLWDVLKENI
jgi:spore germination protein YaaH